jgi:hypothetical protein
MNKETKKSLDAIFAKHDATKKAAAKIQEDAKAAESASLAKFLEIRESVIRPAMTMVGEYVKSKGYAYEIHTEEDDVSRSRDRNRIFSASIQISFLKGISQTYEMGNFPFLSVSCDKTEGSVHFVRSTMYPGRGGQSGPAGTAAIEDITQDLVQAKILEILAAVFD